MLVANRRPSRVVAGNRYLDVSVLGLRTRGDRIRRRFLETEGRTPLGAVLLPRVRPQIRGDFLPSWMLSRRKADRL